MTPPPCFPSGQLRAGDPLFKGSGGWGIGGVKCSNRCQATPKAKHAMDRPNRSGHIQTVAQRGGYTGVTLFLDVDDFHEGSSDTQVCPWMAEASFSQFKGKRPWSSLKQALETKKNN